MLTSVMASGAPPRFAGRVVVGSNSPQGLLGMASMQNVGLGKMVNVGGAYSLNVGLMMNTIVGMNRFDKTMNSHSVSAGKEFAVSAGGASSLLMDEEAPLIWRGAAASVWPSARWPARSAASCKIASMS